LILAKPGVKKIAVMMNVVSNTRVISSPVASSRV